MNIKRTSGGLPPPDTGEVAGEGIAKAEPDGRTNSTHRSARSNAAESEDLGRLKAAVAGYTARDLNDAARTKEVVEKVAKELVETGTRSIPGLTGKQKADLAKFAEEDPVMSTKILSFVREQVG